MKTIQAVQIAKNTYTISYFGITLQINRHYKYIAADLESYNTEIKETLYNIMLYEYIPTLIRDANMWNNSSYGGKFNHCKSILVSGITDIDWKESLMMINYEN